jgi:hypothetical protein
MHDVDACGCRRGCMVVVFVFGNLIVCCGVVGSNVREDLEESFGWRAGVREWVREEF